MTQQYKEPFIGQLWTSTDSKEFRVMDLAVTEDDAWVTYTSVDTRQEFSCRLEAFKYRFRPLVD